MRHPLRRALALLLVLLVSRAALARTPDKTVTPSPEPATQKTPGLTPVVGRNITYVVKPGEDLYTLGLRHHLAIEHLMWANGLTSEQVAPGTKIIIPLQHVLPATLNEGLIINLPERGVYLFKGGEFIAFYPCAIGMGGRFATPTGDTRIVNKQVDPTWDPPEWSGLKEPVGPGPNNPLGDRWIGLGLPGVGLHGTTQPMSIGQNASHGCMRMYPSVVRILFDQVKIGMPVRVMYETVKVGIGPDDNKVYVQTYPDVYGRMADKTTVLREKLERAGLTPFVDNPLLKRLAADKSGLPQHVLGDDVVVKVNNQRVATTIAPFMRDGQIWTSAEVIRALGARIAFDDKILTVSLNGKTVRFDGDAKKPDGARSNEKASETPAPATSPDATPTSASPESSATAAASATATVTASGEPTTSKPIEPQKPVAPTVASLAFTPLRWNGKTIVPVKPLLQSFGLTFKWVPEHKTLLIYVPDKEAKR